MLEKVRAWYPERTIILVGDGGYAAVELVAACQRLKMKPVSRLRTDAQLHAFAGEQPSSKRGPGYPLGGEEGGACALSCGGVRRPEDDLVSE